MEIVVDRSEETAAKKILANRVDPEAARIKRFLALPDLSRRPDGPLSALVKRILNLPDFADFDLINAPEIVPADQSFDLFDFPPDHPARSRSDTYYVNDRLILRTHTTIMWYYHLRHPRVREKIAAGKTVAALSFGKVYRKDEIDRQHMNVFHQMDGWFLCRRREKIIGEVELKQILQTIARAIFGPAVRYRFNPDQFPYTDPSLEMEVEINERWLEILGSGVVKGSVLQKLGVDPQQYNGWAFGFGLERLALLSMDLPDIRLLWSEDPRVKRQLNLGQKYKAVSKYPPVIRDISFVVTKSFIPNDYFDLIRDLGGDLVEEVSLLDRYQNDEKFGPDKISYSYRIVYRSTAQTLADADIKPLHQKIEEATRRQFGAEIR